MTDTLDLSLFGTCAVRLSGASPVEIRGVKHRALFALLATAPLGRRSRTYLQETLWGAGSYDSGHLNLRRALSDLRKLLKEGFDEILTATSVDVELNLDRVRFHGGPEDGPFLQDLAVRNATFEAWRDTLRADPGPFASLGARQPQHVSGRLFPTVCALPLTVPDGDANLRVAADWAAEEVCRMLSRSSFLSVISHLSSRAMATRLIDVAQVRDTLGVDYLLIGTLRRVASELIVDFDLIDTCSGTIEWNRNLICLETRLAADLPDRLGNVVRAIGRTVADNTLREARQTPLPTLSEQKLLIAGVAAMHRRTLRDFLAARSYLIEAERRNPGASQVQAWLGKWYTLSVFKGYTTDRQADTDKALDHTARALDIDPESSFALTIDGFIHSNLLGNFDTADGRYLAAQDINPSESLAWLLRGSLMAFRDDGMAAIRATQTARRLSPIDPFGYYYDSLAATAHLSAGNFDRALELAERSLAINDRHISTLRARITALHALDRGEEARAAANELKRCFPSFTLSDYRRTHPSVGNKLGQLVIEALDASGVA